MMTFGPAMVMIESEWPTLTSRAPALDRTGCVMDPSGHVWTIATRIEETTEQERKDRWSGIVNESDGAGSRG